MVLQVLKAGESTTFDVIFLARLPESVQTALYIQTSLGTFDYKVQSVEPLYSGQALLEGWPYLESIVLGHTGHLL